jgi:hypothetical protein
MTKAEIFTLPMIGNIHVALTVCTGALINNSLNDYTPYFLTANHCISNDIVARTLEIYWNYKTSSCNGTPPSLYSCPRSSYATYLIGRTEAELSDFTLLEILGTMPRTLAFAGWTTTDPSGQVVGIHHPEGSYKRISFGNTTVPIICLFDTNYWHVDWSSGTTEPGSSGSPLLNTSKQIIGQLYGERCNLTSLQPCDSSFVSSYGKFSKSYPIMQSYLAGGSDDSLEENDTRTGAKQISTSTWPACIVKVLDPDWYKISVPANTRISIDISFNNLFGDIDIELYRGSDTAAIDVSTGVGDSEHVEHDNLGSGIDYYAHVYLADDNRNTYALSVSSTALVPDIRTPLSDISFGNVNVGSALEKTTTIYNDGTNVLTINSIIRASGSTDFSYVGPSTPFSIMAGSSQLVTVRFSSSSAGGKAAVFNVNSNDSDETNATFNTTGTGVPVPDIRTPISAISFGNVDLGNYLDKTTTIYNDGAAALTVNSIIRSSGSENFSYVGPPWPFNISASGSQVITIRFTPSFSTYRTAVFNVNSTDPDEADVTFGTSGTGVQPPEPDIRTPITAINFGNVGVGNTVDQTTSIYNDGNATLTISGISRASGSTEFTYVGPSTPFNIAAGGSQVVTVRFSPSSAGGKAAVFNVSSNDPDESTVTFNTTGTGLLYYSISGHVRDLSGAGIESVDMNYGDDELVDQTQENTGNAHIYSLHKGTEHWQEFRPSTSKLARVAIRFFKVGYSGDLFVSIKDSNGNILWSNLVAVDQIPVQLSWLAVPIEPTLILVPEEPYRICLSTTVEPLDDSNVYYWEGDIGGNYVRGTSDVAESGSYPEYDFRFRTYSGDVSIFSDSEGYYRIFLNNGWTGIVTPSKDGYQFSPYARSYSSLSSYFLDQDYIQIDNPPTISITNPQFGSTVSGTVTVQATATDDYGIAKVEFHVDSQLRSTDFSAPYSWSWDTTIDSNGSHTLAAVSQDTIGQTNTIVGPVTVSNIIDSPPLVTITNPPAGSEISGTVIVDVTATDDFGVTKVEFFVDSQLRGTDFSAPYSWAWDTTVDSDGSHSLAAVAHDTIGQTNTIVEPITIHNLIPQSIPFSESFSSSNWPYNWRTQNIGVSIVDRWLMSYSNEAGGAPFEMRCQWQSVNPGITRLMTPPLDTRGYSTLNLSFNHFLDGFASGTTLKIQTSTDGSSWTDEGWVLACTISDVGPELIKTTIVNNLNSPITYVAFVITDNLYQFNYWYIDDVSITAGEIEFTTPSKNLSNSASAVSKYPKVVSVPGTTNVLSLWVESVGDNDALYFSRSTDGGTTWRSPLALSPMSGQILGRSNDMHDFYSISMDVENPYVHVVMQKRNNASDDFEIYYNRSTNLGQTWGSWVQLTTNSADTRHPDVSARSGYVHVTYQDAWPGNNEIMYKRILNNGGGAVDQTRRLSFSSSGNSCFPRIAVSKNGDTVHIVYEDNYSGQDQIYYKRIINSGAGSYSTRQLTSGAYWNGLPDIAVSTGIDDQYVYIVYQGLWPGNREIMYKRLGNGGLAGGSYYTARLTYSTSESRSNAVSFDGETNAVNITYHDNWPGNYDVMYRRLLNYGGSGFIGKRISWGSGDSAHATVGQSSGAVYVVWADNSLGNYEIFYRKGN